MDALSRRCETGRFDLDTPAELAGLTHSRDQDRAIEALRFGAGMRAEGDNLFVASPQGIGKRRLPSMAYVQG